jgi:hypothetical protein
MTHGGGLTHAVHMLLQPHAPGAAGALAARLGQAPADDCPVVANGLLLGCPWCCIKERAFNQQAPRHPEACLSNDWELSPSVPPLNQSAQGSSQQFHEVTTVWQRGAASLRGVLQSWRL